MSDEQDPAALDEQQDPPPEAESAEAPRDAIVFLAGIGTEEVGLSIDATARRIASALDDEAPPSAEFMLQEGRDEDFGKSRDTRGSTRRITVVRKAGADGKDKPLLDLYSLDYRGTLIGDLHTKTPLKVFLLILAAMISFFPRLLESAKSRSKSSTEKWQVGIAWGWFSMLGLYAILVLLAAVGTLAPAIVPAGPAEAGAGGDASVQEAVETGSGSAGESQNPPPGGIEQRAQETAERVRAWLARAWEPVTVTLQYLVVWITAIGLLFKTDLKAMIQKSGVEALATIRYLSVGTGAESVADRFSALLNHIAQKDDVRYRKIYVVTYSFGGIAAIDALFPHGEPIGIFRSVDGLVTIACPFDFVRAYWPDYFEGRSAGMTSQQWLNIYARADVLSSNFQDEPEPKPKRKAERAAEPEPPEEAGVRLKGGAEMLRPKSILYGRDKRLDEYSRPERFLLIGFRKHGQYWEDGSAGCFRQVVRELYPDEIAG